MVLKIFKVNAKNPLPGYMTEDASGIDLHASIEEPVIIPPGEYRCIPAGIKISLPKGYEVQIRPRSGLSLKNGVTVLNAPGTVDSDYRGEIKVILINHGSGPFMVTEGMRIAQMVVASVVHAQVREVELEQNLESTERSGGGFGHTGI